MVLLKVKFICNSSLFFLGCNKTVAYLLKVNYVENIWQTRNLHAYLDHMTNGLTLPIYMYINTVNTFSCDGRSWALAKMQKGFTI